MTAFSVGNARALILFSHKLFVAAPPLGLRGMIAFGPLAVVRFLSNWTLFAGSGANYQTSPCFDQSGHRSLSLGGSYPCNWKAMLGRVPIPPQRVQGHIRGSTYDTQAAEQWDQGPSKGPAGVLQEDLPTRNRMPG